MSTPKGYSSQEKEDRLRAEFATIEPTGEKTYGLSVYARSGHFLASADDVVEAGSTETLINAIAHGARQGDLILFKSGANDRREVFVTIERDETSIPANSFKISPKLPVAPTAGDTFDILRPISPRLSDTGEVSINPGPIQFELDGANVTVREDTVTPANNRPLPVKLVSVTGDINITANDLNVQLSHSSATPDSTQIGDGTEIMLINASGEAQVADDTARTSLSSIDGKLTTENTNSAAAVALLTTIDADTSNLDTQLTTRASEATLAALNAKFINGTDIGDVTINNGGAANAVNIQDGGNSITVDDGGTSLTIDTAAGAIDIQGTVTIQDGGNTITVDGTVAATQSGVWNITDITGTVSLPTGAATAANQTTANGHLASLAGTVAGSELQVDVVSSALPTGAATEVTLAAADTKLGTIAGAVSGTEMQVDVVAPLPAGTNNIGDVDIASALPAGSNTIGSVDLNRLDVFNSVYNDNSGSNIPGSATAPLELVASLSQDLKQIQVADTGGAFYELMTGAAASEVRKLLIGPGFDQTVDVNIASGTRVSIRRVDSTTALADGAFAINFLG